MFATVAGFEFRYQLRNPVFWVAVGLFFLLTFGAATSDNISIGSLGNVHKNSPFAAVETELVLSLFFLFVSIAFVANVVVRDDDTGFGPIIRATRLRKFDYLMGRFAGAFGAILVAFLAVPLAILVGSLMPWVDPEKLGPLRLGDYAYNYLFLVIPALFVPAASFFALATATRSLMATYVGATAALVVYFVATALGTKPEYMHTTALLDPFGLNSVDFVTRYWTAAERNTRLVPITGVLVWNRLIWLAVACGLLVLGYRLFRFDGSSRRAWRRQKLAAAAAVVALAPDLSFVRAQPRFDAATAWAQLLARTRIDMTQVFRSPAFFVLLSLGALNAFASLWFQDAAYGVPLYPITRLEIGALFGAFTLIPVIVAIYYAGELVWREVDRRTDEIVDATPVPDWAFMVPKVLAIALVFVGLLFASVLTALLVQVMKGYDHFELWKYLAWYLLPLTVSFTLLAMLALFVQALSPHKFVGWGVMVVFIIAQMVSGRLGYEHVLYRYGGGVVGPVVPLSDMNGLGEAGIGAWWVLAYWTAFALALSVLTYALWRRGRQSGLAARFRRLPYRLAGPAGALLGVLVIATAAIGSYIYLNTNIWNVYHTDRGDETWLADEEKALLHYSSVPQPKITDVTLNVALYPHTLSIVTHGSIILQNKTAAPIADLHVRFDRWTHVDRLDVPGAELKTSFDRFNYRIYTFAKPMLPGERRTITFDVSQQQKGFSNRANVTNIRVYDNGSFLDSFNFCPTLGMSRLGLLTDRAKRRQHGLPADLRPPKLEDTSAQQYSQFIHDADWVNSDITVSTDADQIPIAPGYVKSDVVANGRHVTRFVSDSPILYFFSIQSARYAVQRETYKGIDLAVYYFPAHVMNVQRMLNALKVGLDYDQKNFSPFQFHQMRILEFPAYATFAQSFANTVPYSEAIGFVFDVRDHADIDTVNYVTAHELGHQWWAHQAIGADMQGSTMLTESLAQYTALMAMQQVYGRDQIRKFLKYELDAYLKSRGGEVVEELPLDRVEDQAYIHYRKGALVMYRLSDVIGQDAVDRALHQYLAQHAFKAAPYPRSIDLIALFRAQAGPDPIRQQLITDLFDKITVYDMRTVTAVSHKRGDGRFDVTLHVTAKKNYADGLGRETEAAMNEPVDIGLFTREPGTGKFTSADIVLLRRVLVHSGAQDFTFTTDRAPTYAGIDPYNTMINRNSDQNNAAVTG
jgi:ABC-2 type transport system permease protein